MITFGEKLKAVLKKEGITQQEYADRIGTKRMAIGHLATNRRGYNQKDIEHLVEQFPDVDLNWLLKPHEVLKKLEIAVPPEKYDPALNNAVLKKKMLELLNQIE